MVTSGASGIGLALATRQPRRPTRPASPSTRRAAAGSTGLAAGSRRAEHHTGGGPYVLTARLDTPPPPIIVADALGTRFGDVTAVGGVSFAVDAGRVLGLLGPNGAGKPRSPIHPPDDEPHEPLPVTTRPLGWLARTI